ncbi:hypothetical protein COU75_02845 [Candidatus Peregrinibacteria bacterium CG10_big_fil_rev_8_21_14_0_10_42_8]|nr:MAG: hypothetical protein COU75_02845 [Candidatus Peregrinibacteria bacterium CG10_big_fil_rev_8_21_14_0_10_42_8]
MKRLPHATQRIVMALAVGIITVPMTSTALFINQKAVDGLDDVHTTDLRTKAVEDRRRVRAEGRSYWRAMEQYQRAEDAGFDAIKPDRNNLDSIDKALNQDVEEQEVYSAAPAVTSLETEDLLSQDRALLRRYTRARSCPEGLKDFRIPGFYELCNSIVGVGVSPDLIKGLLNHNAYMYGKLRGSAPDAAKGFKLRMQMLQQANDSTRRRDGGVLPSRPTTCANNPDCLEPRYGN